MTRLDRRQFHRLALAAAGWAAGLPACGGDPGDYTEADARALAAQQRREAERAREGGRFGRLVFRGYRGLSELPWFELGPDGRLRTAVDLPGILDIHTHLGIAVLFAPEIDQTRRTERVRHVLDCDATEPGCRLDLDVYMNANFTEAMSRDRTREILAQGLWGSDAAATQTAANLVAEMDDVGVERAAVLPIDLGLPFGDDLSGRWRAAIEAGGFRDRLVPFASVHPRDDDARERLRAAAAAGARGVKLHPEMQRFHPDAPEAMALYEECGRLGLPVVFHAGRSGIEPERLRRYAVIRGYVPAVESFPEVRFVFGHGGARDLARAIPVARRNRNVWLGLSSLGVTQMAEALEALGPEKLVFGSDWPFYHLAVTLAKILVVAGDDPGVRDRLLRHNAEIFLGDAVAGAPA